MSYRKYAWRNLLPEHVPPFYIVEKRYNQHHDSVSVAAVM
jgi:hypothetical protein